MREPRRGLRARSRAVAAVKAFSVLSRPVSLSVSEFELLESITAEFYLRIHGAGAHIDAVISVSDV
jgi:hypothetical protein